jgi:hypothetical protein
MFRLVERRNANMGTMLRTRILLGLIAVIHGVGGIFLDYSHGVAMLVKTQDFGALLSFALILSGLLMAGAALAERFGYTERWCRDFSASTLAMVWCFIFFQTAIEHVATVTLLAPLYFYFCVWAWIAEARAARTTAMQKKKKGALA